jgi:Protein of unknown function (DUF4238)
LDPRWDSSPKSASKYEGYFESSADEKLEAKVELQLAQEVENPVHVFLPTMSEPNFELREEHRKALSRYIVTLFNRSRARRAAMRVTQNIRDLLLDQFLSNDGQTTTVAAKWNLDAIQRGVRLHRLFTREDVIKSAAKLLRPSDADQDAQDHFVDWISRTLTSDAEHERIFQGRWNVLRTNANDPFLLADSPVVSFARIGENQLSYGEGFNKPFVEIIFPVASTTCLHILPSQNQSSRIVRPTTGEINYLQALFVHESGYANQQSASIRNLVDLHGGTARIGENCYRVDATRYSTSLYDLLMSRAG